MRRFIFLELNLKELEGKLSFKRNGKAFNDCAWDISDNSVTLILNIPRILGTTDAILSFFTEDGKPITENQLIWSDSIGNYDVYSLKINLLSLGVGLFFFEIKLKTTQGLLYVKKEQLKLTFTKNQPDQMHQLSISDFGNNKATDCTGIIYHIFVDRFSRGKKIVKKDKGIIIDDWTVIPEYPEYPGAPLKNNTFYGGSLYGIVDKLDYIKSLGAAYVYLSPIFESPSNHKYDTSDYMKVDEAFGGEKALKKLIKEAKRRNIGIIIDGVFNHTGADSVYFNRYGNYGKGGAYNDANSPFYSWYEFKSYPNDYTCWWGIEILPRLNTNNTECMNFFLSDGGVVDKYSKMGIAGIRLDVADELSDDFIKKIKQRLKQNNKNALLFGEVWEDASNKIAYGKRKKYYLGQELDGVMNYPLREGLISYIRNGKSEKLCYALTEIINNAPKPIRDMQMNLLGSHDTERIITALAAKSANNKTNAHLSVLRMSKEEKEQGIELLISAYTLISALPGIPTVYYGDEAGLEGYSDPFNRLPYPWGNENEKLLKHYQKIGFIRSSYKSLINGDFTLNALTNDYLIFTRINGKEKITAVYNNSSNNIAIQFGKEVEEIITNKRAKEFDIMSKKCLLFNSNCNYISILKI